MCEDVEREAAGTNRASVGELDVRRPRRVQLGQRFLAVAELRGRERVRNEQCAREGRRTTGVPGVLMREHYERDSLAFDLELA